MFVVAIGRCGACKVRVVESRERGLGMYLGMYRQVAGYFVSVGHDVA